MAKVIESTLAEFTEKTDTIKLFLYVVEITDLNVFPNLCIDIFVQYYLFNVLPCQKFHSKTWDRIYISNVSTLNKCSCE